VIDRRVAIGDRRHDQPAAQPGARTVDRRSSPGRREEDLDDATRLWWAIDGLHHKDPEMSAARGATLRGRILRWGLGAGLLAGLYYNLLLTATVLSTVVTGLYLAILGYKALVFRQGLRAGSLLRVTDHEARSVPDDELPIVTILVPVYKEPESISQLLLALSDLEYPADRLEVRVLLEEDDAETIDAIGRIPLEAYVRPMIVPPSEPRTKPKACNFGVLGARGDLVVIYDAEDKPEPLQLRRTAYCFARVPDDVVCIQAKLDFYNPLQNRITRWFTLDYGTWFNILLPGLVALGAPVPLGGTSNFFRRRVIEDLGAWDPYNVTEDADLGIRLARRGYRTLVLDSTTYEEANSDGINWVKQRSRWYKGYLQTFAVHLRHPLKAYRELGFAGFVGLAFFVGGTPILAAINPVMWAMAFVWIASQPVIIERLFPGWSYYMALTCLVLGNFLTIYQGLIAARMSGRTNLWAAAISMPGYWLLMSLAAVKGIFQLITSPFHWEKTHHGLHADTANEASRTLTRGTTAHP
jgi:cellulose synthase/poly-beta-1,6-N-acetylglucosamine synthase-like glycosyltransferase